MKFCPYCGASLVECAVSFCSECGRKLPSAAKPPPSAQEQSAVSRPQSEKKSPPAGKRQQLGNQKPVKPGSAPRKGSRRTKPKKPVNRRPTSNLMPKAGLSDDGYDGYYNDVKPIDNGYTRDRTDPELIKRVILVAVGALAIVILSVTLMYVL